MKIDIICGTCGGTNVMRDAWAVWDTRSQEWILGAVFDAGHCDDCETERTLEERPIDDDQPVAAEQGSSTPG